MQSSKPRSMRRQLQWLQWRTKTLRSSQWQACIRTNHRRGCCCATSLSSLKLCVHLVHSQNPVKSSRERHRRASWVRCTKTRTASVHGCPRRLAVDPNTKIIGHLPSSLPERGLPIPTSSRPRLPLPTSIAPSLNQSTPT